MSYYNNNNRDQNVAAGICFTLIASQKHSRMLTTWRHICCLFPTTGDDPPACDRGEDEPESVPALQSTLCGRGDSGWNWWVAFSQKLLGSLKEGQCAAIRVKLNKLMEFTCFYFYITACSLCNKITVLSFSQYEFVEKNLTWLLFYVFMGLCSADLIFTIRFKAGNYTGDIIISSSTISDNVRFLLFPLVN